MSSDDTWAMKRAERLAERHGPLTVAGARPASTSDAGIKIFAQGIGEWHRRTAADIKAVLDEAAARATERERAHGLEALRLAHEQQERAVRDAVARERKALADRLREPSEAMVEAVSKAILSADWKWLEVGRTSRAALKAAATAIEAEAQESG
jgi:hypothetical protein